MVFLHGVTCFPHEPWGFSLYSKNTQDYCQLVTFELCSSFFAVEYVYPTLIWSLLMTQKKDKVVENEQIIMTKCIVKLYLQIYCFPYNNSSVSRHLQRCVWVELHRSIKTAKTRPVICFNHTQRLKEEPTMFCHHYSTPWERKEVLKDDDNHNDALLCYELGYDWSGGR